MTSFEADLTKLKSEQEIDTLLSRFLEKHQASSSFVNDKIMTLDTKKEFIKKLLEWLEPEIGAYKAWNSQVTVKALQTLKTLSREKLGCNTLFSEKGSLITLFHSGLCQNNSYTDSMENVKGLKCLCNIMLQDLLCRDETAKTMKPEFLYTALKRANNVSGIFMVARITFLCTATHRPLAKSLIQLNMPDALANSLVRSLDRTLVWGPEDSWVDQTKLNLEILKSMFNISLVLSEHKMGGVGILGSFISQPAKVSDISEEDHPLGTHFKSSLEVVRRFVLETPLAEIPLSSPITSAVHILMNVPVTTLQTTWFPNGDYTFLEKLTDIFEKTFLKLFNNPSSSTTKQAGTSGSGKEGTDIDGLYHLQVDGLAVDEALPPIIMMLKNIALGDETARKRLLTRLAPADIDRSKPLRTTDTITGLLITFMTSVTMLQVRDCVSELLFVLFDSNPTKLIEYVGYGNAAGYLMGRGMMAAPTDGKMSADGGAKINPITGEIETPKKDPFAGMTEEEMEEEAEKLFVLFDRLNRTGIVKVQTKSD